METERKSYPLEAYRMIFKAMRERFGEEWYSQIPRYWWNAWSRQIREQLFDNDIIASEAIAVIGDVDKSKWPLGTGFFPRVRDQVLLQRKQPQVKINTGLTSIKDVLRR